MPSPNRGKVCTTRPASHVPEPHPLVGARRGDPGAVGRDRDAPDVVGLSVGLLDRAGLAGLQVPEPDRPVRVTRDQHLAVGREGQARVVRGIFLGVLQARPPRFARRRIPEVDEGAFPALWIESAPRGEDPSVRGEGQGPYERPFPSPVRPVERPRHPAGRGIPEGDLSPVLLRGRRSRRPRSDRPGSPPGPRRRPSAAASGSPGSRPSHEASGRHATRSRASPSGRVGDVATEQLAHRLDVAGLPRLLDREHVGGVQLAGQFLALASARRPRLGRLATRPGSTAPC